MKVGLVGCGRLGYSLANFLRQKNFRDRIQLVFLVSRKYNERAQKIVKDHHCCWTNNIRDALKGVDLILETASAQFIRDWAVFILSSGIDLMALSTGPFVDQAFWERVCHTAYKSKSRIYIPSGAIGGMDILKAARLTRIDKLLLVSRQSSKNFDIVENRELQSSFKNGPTLLFEGSAQEAVKRYPKHINIAATVLIATKAWNKLTVKLISDPSIKCAQHKLFMEGEIGKLSLKFTHRPVSESIRIGNMSWQSAVSFLLELNQSTVHIGT